VELLWSSDDESVATVSGGVVTAVGNGTVVVTAAVVGAEDVVASVQIVVEQEVSSVVVTPDHAVVVEGTTVQLEAVALDANGHAVDAAEFTWESADETVATVNSSGLVTTVSEGSTTIRAATVGVEGIASVTVVDSDREELEAFFDATDGPNWKVNTNWKSNSPISTWAGVTVNSFGKATELNLPNNNVTGALPAGISDFDELTTLNLDTNSLTGAIPSQLGSLSKLQDLRLGNNNFEGLVPAQLGQLTALTKLGLDGNNELDGELPLQLTNMTSLQHFRAGGTYLCAPGTRSFQDWLDQLTIRELADCDPTEFYLVQAVQQLAAPVPLLEGEEALLRVFVTTETSTTQTIPAVLAVFLHNGTVVDSVFMEPGNQAIPTEIDESNLALSQNIMIAGSIIQPGLEAYLRIDPNVGVDPALGVRKRVPTTGTISIEVDNVPEFELTLIPFKHPNDDSTVVDTVAAMVEDPYGHPLLRDLRTLLPVKDIDAEAYGVVVTDALSADDVLDETDAIRLLDGGSGYYAGLAVSFSDYLGVAWLPGYTMASVLDSDVMGHEWGHNLSLFHAPCGGAPDPDPNYPYGNGIIGVYGYNASTENVVSRFTTDIMGYCTNNWISDYMFKKALNYRHNLAVSGPASTSLPVDGLLVSGRMDAQGRVFLNPAFAVNARPSVPTRDGPWTLTARVGPTTAFSYSFEMDEIPDANAAGFMFMIPTDANSITEISLSGPGGTATLDENTNEPKVIIQDPVTRQVRAILRQDPAEFQPGSYAANLLAEFPNLNVMFSRGLPVQATANR